MKKQFTNKARYLGLKLTAIIFALLLFASGQSWGQVNISVGGTYTQNFDGLGTTAIGTFTNNTTLAGYYITSAGLPLQTGASNSNSVYNCGILGTNALSDRALGALSTGTTHRFGLRLKNNGAGSITSFDISFTGEQWRAYTASTLVFEYQISAAGSTITSLTSGTWTAFNSLDFASLTTNASGAATDGNNASYRTAKSATLTVTVPANAEIFFRWTKAGSSSPCLAIDDLSITANGTITSSVSDIIANTSFTYPTNIAYNSYQGTNPLTTSNSIEVAQFDIRDGGSSAPDADALATTLTGLTLNVANSGSLRRIALFDGTNNIGEVAGGATAAFSGLALAAADNGSKTFSVRVSFLSSVTDNQQFSFTVNSATASGSGSGFAAANAGAAVTSTTGDNNRIEVTASDIIFDQNVSTVALGAVMSPSPTLRAIDANVNYDLDYSASYTVAVTIGAATFDGTATTTGSFSSGVATLSNLKFNAAGTSNNITVTSGSYSDISNAFDVTNPQPEINIKQNVTSIATSGSYAFGSLTSGTSSSAITFTIENLGTADLNLSGTPKVAISGTNASEFTIDETSTSATVASSGTTTFTITFSPTSQGAKTAQISIANNDATGSENPYIINLTGTSTVTSVSDITNITGYSYTSNVDYASKQSATNLTTGNSIGVNGLTIRDGAGATDADNLGTTLTAISFTTGGSTAIRTAALFVDGTNVNEVAVNGATTITFSGLNITAADNGTKDFELRVTYQSSVTDNQQITFTVSSATASSTGSGFATANAGAAASTATSDINRIEVTATALVFGVNPSNVTINSVMSPSPTVIAKDGNSNIDLDFVGDVTLTSTGTISGTATNPVTAVGGTATFDNLKFSALGTGITIAGTSGSLTATGNSSSFNVTVQAAGVLLTEEDFNYTSATNLTANGWSAHSSGGTNPIKVHTSGLSYSGYGSTAIGNAAIVNASGEDVNKTFTQQNSGTTTYCAFLINISSATSGGDYIMHLGPTTILSEFRCRLYTKYTGGNLTFGISTHAGIGSTINYSTTNYAYNTTYLIVLKHFFNGSTQTSSLFINPSLTSEPSSPDATETSTTSLSTNIGTVAIRQSSTSNIAIIDGIRVGTNWGAVLGNPQYDASANIAAGNYNDVSLLSGTLTQTGNVTTKGTLTLTNGTLAVGSNTLTIGGPISIGSGTVTNSSGTVDFAQTSTTTIPWTSFNNMTTSGVGPFSLSGNTTIGGNLSIASGSVLNVASDKQLTVTGTLTNNAGNTGLVLKSDATGTASLINSTAGVSATVERYITQYSSPTNGWRLVSSPVGTTAIGNFLPGTNDDFYGYDEANNLWLNYKVSPFGFTNGLGYLSAYETSATKSFSGALNTADITFTNQSLTPANGNGWHLLGNPYASAIKWNDGSWALSNVSAAAKLLNGGGSYTDLAANDIIPAMQGFFVKVSDATNSITIPASARTHSTTTNILNKASQQEKLVLKASSIGNSTYVESTVKTNANATNGFDADYDANFLAGMYGAPQLYSIITNNQLSTNTIAPITSNLAIPMGFVAGLATNYKITADGLSNFTSCSAITLEDLKTNTTQNLMQNPVYNFTATTTDNANRFVLHFATAVGVNEIGNSNGSIYAYDNSIYVNANEQIKQISVYNAMGQLVKTLNNVNGLQKINMNGNATGYYIVRVVSDKNVYSEKVLIK